MRPILSTITPTTYSGNITLSAMPTDSLYQLFVYLAQWPALTGVTILSNIVIHGGAHSVTMPLTSYQTVLTRVTTRCILHTPDSYMTFAQATAYLNDFLGTAGFSIQNVYRCARLDLITSMGQFCSYCEMPVGDSRLDVEHKLAKSKFLDESCSFSNLLLACPMCNSFKGQNPTPGNYYDPIHWGGITAVRDVNGNDPSTWAAYGQIKSVLRNAYMWPTYQRAYHAFPLEIWSNPNPIPLGASPPAIAAWQAACTSPPAATSAAISLIRNGQIQVSNAAATGWVCITVNGNSAAIPTLAPPPVPPAAPGVVSTAGPPYPQPPPGTPVGTPPPWPTPSSASMVDGYEPLTGQGLLKLNNIEADMEMSDRRVFNRTKAWFAAVAAINRLEESLTIGGAASSGETAYDLVLGEVVSTATAAGFFSTWVTVFNARAPATPGLLGPTSIATTPPPNPTADFVKRTTFMPPFGIGFPGTNYSSTVP